MRIRRTRRSLAKLEKRRHGEDGYSFVCMTALTCLLKFNNVKKIGIFDSGIGGLSILNKVRHFDLEKIIYYADSANIPYGEKSAQVIFEGTQTAVNYLEQRGVDGIIIACHTASTYAFHRLTTKHNTPLIEINTPVIEKIATITRSKRAGILATRATVNSSIYPHLLHFYNSEIAAFQQACPDFVPLLEQETTDKKALYAKAEEYCSSILTHDIDTLLLGCTHYAFLEDIIKETVGSAIETVSAHHIIAPLLEKKWSLTPSIRPVALDHIEFITTGNNKDFIAKAQRYLQL
jgi:glutamate racemase